MRITDVSNDVMLSIIKDLKNNDLKQFRLVCKWFYQLSLLNDEFRRILPKHVYGCSIFNAVIFLRSELETAFSHARKAIIEIGYDSLLIPNWPRFVNKFHYNNDAIKMYKAFSSTFNKSNCIQTKAEASYQLFILNQSCSMGYGYGTFSERFLTIDLVKYYYQKTLNLHETILKQLGLDKVNLNILSRLTLLPFEYEAKSYDPFSQHEHRYLNLAVKTIGIKVLKDILVLLYSKLIFNGGVEERYYPLVEKLYDKLENKKLLLRALSADKENFIAPLHISLSKSALDKLRSKDKMAIENNLSFLSINFK